MGSLRIALFRNDGSTASVAYADLPSLDDNEPVVQFNAFRTLQVPQGHALRSKTASNPVYANDMVYWAVHGELPDTKESAVSVWRMGKHFAIESVDRAGGMHKHSKTVETPTVNIDLKAQTRWGCASQVSDFRPALVVDDKTITVCCAGWSGQLSVSQKIVADGSWAMAFARTNNELWYPTLDNLDRKVTDNEARSLVMLSGSSFGGGNIEYTYRFVSEPAGGSPLRIDMMKTANLVNLRKDNTLSWHNVTAETHIPGNDHAYVITHAENGESNKLLFFDFGGDGSFIYCRWIDLHKDGFIDTDKNRYHQEQKYGSQNGWYEVGPNGMHLEIAKGAPGTGHAPWCGPSSRQIMAFTWTDDKGQNLLLMWHTDLGYAGIAGRLDESGGIPYDWQWKNAKIYKHGDATPANSYDLYGILVAKGFC